MLLTEQCKVENLLDISTKINTLAREAGGGHLSNEELQEVLLGIGKELSDMAFELRKSIDATLAIVGFSETDYKRALRQENIERKVSK